MIEEQADVIVEDEVVGSTDDSEKDQELLEDDNNTGDNDEESNESETSDDESTDESESSEDDEESEDIVTIGDEESPPQEESKKAPAWVKELRKKNREITKQNRELQEKLNSLSGVENKPAQLGKKPTLEDFDYDAELFETELTQWFERKREVDEQQAKIKSEQEAQEKEWQDRLTAYNEAKTKLKVSDQEEAEFVAQEKLSNTQQGMIIEGAENPALVMYALGKNTKKLEELASIKNPVRFSFAVSKLETQLKVTSKKRPATRPETKVKSNSSGTNAIDSTLERLREEASKTGDFTKVIQYKNSLKK